MSQQTPHTRKNNLSPETLPRIALPESPDHAVLGFTVTKPLASLDYTLKVARGSKVNYVTGDEDEGRTISNDLYSILLSFHAVNTLEVGTSYIVYHIYTARPTHSSLKLPGICF